MLRPDPRIAVPESVYAEKLALQQKVVAAMELLVRDPRGRCGTYSQGAPEPGVGVQGRS